MGTIVEDSSVLRIVVALNGWQLFEADVRIANTLGELRDMLAALKREGVSATGRVIPRSMRLAEVA